MPCIFWRPGSWRPIPRLPSRSAWTRCTAACRRWWRGIGPSAAAVEETVVNVNADSSLKLGHARGVVLLAAAHAGLEVTEYAAKTIKRAVVGTGAAQKRQVAMMVRMLLPGSGRLGGDAADALAVALCHAQHHAAQTRLPDALAPAPPTRPQGCR